MVCFVLVFGDSFFFFFFFVCLFSAFPFPPSSSAPPNKKISIKFVSVFFKTVSWFFFRKVVIVGGGDQNGARVVDAEIYDPALGTWSVLAPFQHQHILGATVLFNGEVVVIGGGIKDVERLDLQPVPTPTPCTNTCANNSLCSCSVVHVGKV